VIIKLPMLLESTLRHTQKILEPHGVKIAVHEEPLEGERFPCWLLHLPEGTRREKDKPTGAYHEHYKITLPDGFVIFQEIDTEGWSVISYSLEQA
jgi:hypothetical protein